MRRRGFSRNFKLVASQPERDSQARLVVLLREGEEHVRKARRLNPAGIAGRGARAVQLDGLGIRVEGEVRDTAAVAACEEVVGHGGVCD